MLKAIARLLFGGEEQPPDDFRCGEMPEEEWQVVSHQGRPREMLLCKYNPPPTLVQSGVLITSTGTDLCVGTRDVSTEVSSAAHRGPEQTPAQQSGPAQRQDTAANTPASDLIRWENLFIAHL